MPFCYRVVTAGLLFLVNPVIGMNSLAMVFCCLFILGVFSYRIWGQTVPQSGLWMEHFHWYFDLLIAGVWLNMDPDRSYVFTSIFIGVEMIFSSLAFISLRRNATLVKLISSPIKLMLPLERIVNIKMMVSAAILVTSVMAPMTRAFATQATEAAPQDMTCKEFVDMSQQYKTAIAFVIVNKNSDFKGDDYVPLHEVETEAVPKMVKMCHQHPNTKLGELAVNLKGSGLHY